MSIIYIRKLNSSKLYANEGMHFKLMADTITPVSQPKLRNLKIKKRSNVVPNKGKNK